MCYSLNPSIRPQKQPKDKPRENLAILAHIIGYVKGSHSKF